MDCSVSVKLLNTGAGHALKAKDVHFAENREKILLVLHSSKTHNRASRPQKIKIAATTHTCNIWNKNKHFCLFEITCEYIRARGNAYFSDEELFFLLADRTPLPADVVRRNLKAAIKALGLNPQNYDTHSFRSGCVSDLMKMGCPVDTIKQTGRWKSNAVYKYLRF